MVFIRFLGSFLILTFLISSCTGENSNGKTEGMLFHLIDPEYSGLRFSNMLYPTTELNVITFEYFYNGAGVAIGDINNDGLQDIYFSGNMVPGKLYLNKGGLKFQDITDISGIDTTGKWGTGVTMVDINADGLLDLYLCFSGPYDNSLRKNMLFINNGDMTFTEKAQDYGIDDDSHTTQAAFFDYDLDGDLDVYLLNNMTDRTGPNIIRPKRNEGQMINTDRLYRNDGNFFTNVSKESGVLKEGYGLGIAIGDINQDGYPDIYASNDYLSNDLLYLNNGNNTFTDKAGELFKHTSYSSMGCDMADFNNDGLLDIAALDMLPPDQKRRMEMIGSINHKRFQSELESGYDPQFMRNTLQLNVGTYKDQLIPFREIGQYAGIASTDWSWSPIFADVDNDGHKDLLVTNGYPKDITNLDFASYKANNVLKGSFNNKVLMDLVQQMEHTPGAYLPNFGFRNRGDLSFEDCSVKWGFTQNSFSHGAAVADLDNDGDLDYVTNNSYDTVFLYENTSKRKHHENDYLRLCLKGKAPNLAGWGAKVWLYQDDDVQFQEHYPVKGYQSTMEPILHFGLGGKEVDSLVIVWPDKATQTFYSPHANQVLQIAHDGVKRYFNPTKSKDLALFKAMDIIAYQHREKDVTDFDKLQLLLQNYTNQGPDICVGDVNKDGFDDFFVGGAEGQEGRIFIQRHNGTFSEIILSGSNGYEDLGATFFDADNDGDLDLYVCSGSTEFSLNSKFLKDRLYENKGDGRFLEMPDVLPNIKSNSACVTAADYDGDGDLDLFIGSGAAPETYDIQASYILENQSGRFADVTKKVAPELIDLGIVTKAQWVDMNNDGLPELWISGEWLPLTLFSNKKGRLENITEVSKLAETIGLWNTFTLADLDEDGDIDLIAGNMGTNTPYKTSKEKPFSRFIGDFDSNGQTDFLIAHYLEEKQVPLHFRDDLLGWLQPLKKRFPDYQSYATASWDEVLPDGVATIRTDLNTFATSWIENLGDGFFTLHKLPKEAQFASVYGILIEDFNNDGILDILLNGNSRSPNSFAGYSDAMNGLLLFGDGKRNFIPQTIQKSGFYMAGEGRALAMIRKVDSSNVVLATQNNGAVKTFLFHKKK